jgi:hypothetical protein
MAELGYARVRRCGFGRPGGFATSPARTPSAIMVETAATRDETATECQACGACCSFSAAWPRFSLESDADLDRIPPALVDGSGGRMRCHGDRCAALVGEVGVWTSCSVYAVRPEVCRACLPGDDACRMARERFNL